MTTRAERRRAARNGTELKTLPGILPPEDLADLRETLGPYAQRFKELQIEINTLQSGLNGMLTVFLKAKGYPTNLNLDLKTGKLTPNKPQQQASSPDGVAREVPEKAVVQPEGLMA